MRLVVEPVPVRPQHSRLRERRRPRIILQQERVALDDDRFREGHQFDRGDAVLAGFDMRVVRLMVGERDIPAPQDLLRAEPGSFVLVLQCKRCGPALRNLAQPLLLLLHVGAQRVLTRLLAACRLLRILHHGRRPFPHLLEARRPLWLHLT